MRYSLRTVIVLALVTILGNNAANQFEQITAAEPNKLQTNEKKLRTKDELEKKYKDLISQLASPNKEPKTNNDADATVKFPKGYDVEAQLKINKVRKELHDNVEEAMPYLVMAFDDKRYCLTIDWAEGDGYYNETVGSICENIVASTLEVYRNAIRFSDAGQFHKYDYPISKKWWERRKDRPLIELQIEAIDWAIEQHKKEKDMFDDSNNEALKALNVQRVESKTNEVKQLETLRDEIKKSGKSVKSRGLWRMITHSD